MTPAYPPGTLSVLGTWSKPPDALAWTVAGVALILLVIAFLPAQVQRGLGLDVEHVARDAAHRRRVIMVAGFGAAFLSLGYVAVYLRGGPRIIDATSYFLQGRALAHSKLAWHLSGPSASFRGRFLLFREPDRLAGIFPPGYPLLLASGFLVGAPMVVGPLLAAALVVATYVLARELCLGDERLENQVVPVSLLAVALSVVCAALRYHTADTMAHGASALGITVALATALRGRRTGELPWFAFAGFAVGWVVSTRIVSALPIGAVVLALAAGASARPRALGVAAAAMLPGILVLLLAQHATTGHWLASTQRAYYATSDGPPGCFRYGFGSGIGCLYEHGDFVRAHLTHGYGLVAALGTTLRRLRMHLLDVANFEPLALLVFLPFASGFRRRRGALFALVVVLGQVLVYAPFYFDGNYPGGGARLFADALPIEHVLIAVGVASVLPFVPLLRRGLVLVAIALLGFSVHAVHDHLALQKRDGGRPLYEPDVAHDNQVTHGLVFFDNDAAFNLAYDPTAEPSHVALAARQRNDDHDRLLYEHLGRPPTYAYRFGAESSSISVWVPTVGTNDDFWRFEAESDWPPLAQQGGWAEPAWASGTCASGEHVLTVHPVPETGTSSATIELPAPRAGSWLVTPRVMRRGGHGKGKLRLLAKGQTPLEWTWNDGDARDACNDLPPQEAPLSLEGARLEVTAAGGAVALDRTNLRWLQPPKGTR